MTEEEIVAVAIHNGLYPHQQIGGFAGMHGSQQYTLFQAARAAIEALDKHRAEKAGADRLWERQPGELSPPP